MSVAPASETAVQAGKFLTFRIGAEEYAVEILKVQEIIGMMDVTRVPRTPDYFRGVINLRGKIIPLIDIRRKFGMPIQEDTKRTCVIVARVVRGESAITMGIIVDEVSEVLNVSGDQIEPTPSFGTGVDTEFIRGMGKVGQRVLIILDIDKVLAENEVAAIKRVAESS